MFAFVIHVSLLCIVYDLFCKCCGTYMNSASKCSVIIIIMALKFSRLSGFKVMDQNSLNIVLINNSSSCLAYLNVNIIFQFLEQFPIRLFIIF